MGERVSPGPSGCGNDRIREMVCVDTSKVYDACRSKECIQDLRVYLTRESQELLDRSTSVKPRRAELLWAQIDVEPVDFRRGFYSVDVRYYYKVFAEVSAGCGRMVDICGLATFDKRAILFGSEGGARIFSSQFALDAADPQMIERSNKPRAVVETLDPLILSAKIVEPNRRCGCCSDLYEVPDRVGCLFGDDIILDPDVKKLYVTLGQFSIIRLERDIQLLMPAYDVCMPAKDCSCSSDDPEDPCDVFEQFEFPMDEFFPPRRDGDDMDFWRPHRRPDPCGCGNGNGNGNGDNGNGNRPGNGGGNGNRPGNGGGNGNRPGNGGNGNGRPCPPMFGDR